MSILSYLIFPEPGKKNELQSALATIPNCDLIPSDNKDLLVLVAESDSKEGEAELRLQLESIPSLAGFSLVAGFDDTTTPTDDSL